MQGDASAFSIIFRIEQSRHHVLEEPPAVSDGKVVTPVPELEQVLEVLYRAGHPGLEANTDVHVVLILIVIT